MNLTIIQKKIVIDALKEKYNIGLSISDTLNLQMNKQAYQVCSVITDKVKILFVLFDGNDHSDKETQVKQLCKMHN